MGDFKNRKANMKVYNAFIGHPKKHDPSHVKLKETGWAMAKRVFHPPDAERWPTKEANAFMAKYLTLVPHQRKELESNLAQESFLKDHEKNLAYKQALKFKNRMLQYLKTQRTSLISILKFRDSVTDMK